MGLDPAAPFPTDPQAVVAAELADLKRRLAVRERAGLAQQGGERWHNIGDLGEPGFSGTWGNDPRNQEAPAGFYRDGSGFVHLRGTFYSAVAPIATLFYLPPGYRPAYRSFQFGAAESDGNANTFGAGLFIYPTGEVATGAALNTNLRVHLDNQGFRTT